MRLAIVEIQNFRKLKAVQIAFATETTLLVGANNSGKTSAMVALRYFMLSPNHFTVNDLTLCHWGTINSIGKQWEDHSEEPPTLETLNDVLPALDVWLDVQPNEVHYVRDIIPTLSWSQGMIGVRLRYEPVNIQKLHEEYLSARRAVTSAAHTPAEGGEASTFSLWPKDLREFLERRLASHFTVHTYLLDPAKIQKPHEGIARPQTLPTERIPLEGHPLKKLIRVDEIVAQRGFGETSGVADTDSGLNKGRRKLSDQLRSYYARHLDPTDAPSAEDVVALQTIQQAQQMFDTRLTTGFSAALNELQGLNYPGVTDPKLVIQTRMMPADGLNHAAAVQYEIAAADGTTVSIPLRLPEDYNGLGYQNLISMVFLLMSFRDGWMKVGRASRIQTASNSPEFRPPLHLVLLEEPEAFLHVQVQQVFLRRAFAILRNHDELRDSAAYQTQLVVSTHSSHIAHEASFSSLRYFRRLPAVVNSGVPTSAVINLSEMFVTDDETAKFAIRYLRATHSELFFADAAILVEGSGERILLPHFIRTHFKHLDCCFVTTLEIGGSHAHRLRNLIEHLGLTTLIITDIDSVEATGHHKSAPPARAAGLLTNNSTLKEWHPAKSLIDDLLAVTEDGKAKVYDMPLFVVRVAYQCAVNVVRSEAIQFEVLAYTFEDALVLENLELFESIEGSKHIQKLKEAVVGNNTAAELTTSLFNAVDKIEKAAVALELLWYKDPAGLKVPKYIHDGLTWLQNQLRAEQSEIRVSIPAIPEGVVQ